MSPKIFNLVFFQLFFVAVVVHAAGSYIFIYLNSFELFMIRDDYFLRDLIFNFYMMLQEACCFWKSYQRNRDSEENGAVGDVRRETYQAN